MFRTVPLSIIRSFSLYTQQWYMSYRFADSLRAGSGPTVLILLASYIHLPLLRVQWQTTDDGQRNCPKHVEFYSKNKYEKLVHLVGFIIATDDVLLFVCLFSYFISYIEPTNAQLFHKLSQSCYMFRHYRVHPQGARSQYLAKLQNYVKCSCW